MGAGAEGHWSLHKHRCEGNYIEDEDVAKQFTLLSLPVLHTAGHCQSTSSSVLLPGLWLAPWFWTPTEQCDSEDQSKVLTVTLLCRIKLRLSVRHSQL